MNKIKYILGVVLLIILVSSCKHKEDEYHSINDKIKAKSKNYHGVSLSSEQYFDDIKMIKITEGEHSFLIPDRKSKIKLYKCTECHTSSLNKLKSKTGKKAHWDIALKHADTNTMNCVTCHNSENLDELKSLTGAKIDFNRSFKLCSQCHTRQFEDWKGGAHGKKIGGWAPPRASMTCVNCHNPHKPHFESRWPARFNTQIEQERK